MWRRLSRQQLKSTYRCNVELTAEAGAAPTDKPVWIQIARTGLWKGYRTGTVEFTAAMFDKLIANFRAHPSFRAGEDGKGTADVIPFDFNHAMEMDPQAVAAESWALDLEARKGATQTELWALTRLLEPARTYIKDGKLKWTSVSVWTDAVHPVTGEKIGPLLTSVAFTNQPFIEGMQPIAARIAAGYIGYYDRACDAEDALRQLRTLLGIPQTSDVATVLGEIAKLRSWATTGTAPFGVDVDGLVGAMRTILGLPALATPSEVFASLDTNLVAALIEQQALDAREAGSDAADLPGGNPGATVTSTGPLAATRTTTMELLLALSKALGTVSKTEDAVIESATEAAQARTSLKALFKAMGVADPDAATTKLADLFAKSKLGELFGELKFEEAKKALDELVTLRKTVGEIEDATALVDVNAVIADLGLPEAMRDVLLESRKKDKVAFAKRFPVTAASERHLTTTLFASDTGGQLGSQRTGLGAGAERTTLTAGANGARVDLRAYPGRNVNEQAQAYIRASVPGADKWDFEKVWEAASDLVRSMRTSSNQVRGN